MAELLAYGPGAGGRRAVDRAAEILRAGGLVAFPTETVYGLGARGLDPGAVARIYAAKGRPAASPLILHVPGEDEARRLAASWPEAAARLARAFWPGPLTLIVPRAAHVPDVVTAGLPSVAIRAPAHPAAQALLAAVAAPLAAPSANRYSQVSPTSARHVERGLGGSIDAILDGGDTPLGIESTVVDLASVPPRLLRPGSIGRAEIEAVIGPLAAAPQVVPEGEARVSPGLSERHYAPSSPARLVAAGEIAEQVDPRTGVIARSPRPPHVQPLAWLHLPSDAAGYARQLYAALHALDERGAASILVEAPPEGPEWEGVRDRLRRATQG